jgi:hypothetical protein
MLWYTAWFAYVEPYLLTWDEANLIIVYELSNMLLFSVFHYFIEDIRIYVYEGDWPVFLYLDVSLSSFEMSVILAS